MAKRNVALMPFGFQLAPGIPLDRFLTTLIEISDDEENNAGQRRHENLDTSTHDIGFTIASTKKNGRDVYFGMIAKSAGNQLDIVGQLNGIATIRNTPEGKVQLEGDFFAFSPSTLRGLYFNNTTGLHTIGRLLSKAQSKLRKQLLEEGYNSESGVSKRDQRVQNNKHLAGNVVVFQYMTPDTIDELVSRLHSIDQIKITSPQVFSSMKEFESLIPSSGAAIISTHQTDKNVLQKAIKNLNRLKPWDGATDQRVLKVHGKMQANEVPKWFNLDENITPYDKVPHDQYVSELQPDQWPSIEETPAMQRIFELLTDTQSVHFYD